MTSPQQAFEVAVSLNLIGVFFDTASVISSVRGYAEGDLAERAAEQAEALKAQAGNARKSIARVQEALSPKPMPEAPQHPDAYAQWAQDCAELVYADLDEAGSASYTAGWWLGAWLLSGNLVALTLYLADVAPDDTYLAEVLGTYAENAQHAVEGLTQAQAQDPANPHLAQALATIQALPAPTLGEGSLEIAGAWQEALEALDEQVSAFGSALSS
ncbi:MAG: hypothetical protein EA397_16550 [Deltaproteobacteria bacterium]|nr:MAG: hypothetical protein EA397_16550 [Deltaproteobacteria bacterium]